MSFVDYVSIIPSTIRLSLLYISVVYKHNVYIAMFLSIMFGTLIEKIFKLIPYPKSLNKFTKRPYLARNCNSLSNDGRRPSGMPGFPSGHMTSTTIFAMWNILIAYDSVNYNIEKLIIDKWINVIVNMLLILVMAYTRLSKRCHTPFQIISGIILGVVIAISTFNFYNKIKDNDTNAPFFSLSIGKKNVQF